MKLKEISISIENSPARLFEVTEALSEAGINLRALNLVETGGGFGLLRLLVSDIVTTRRIMMEMHMPAHVNEVVAAEIEDEPGGLANLLKHLLDARVHTIYMYAFLNFPSEKAVMIFRFSDTDKAIEVLQEKGVSLLDAETFGMLGSTRGLPNETNHGI